MQLHNIFFGLAWGLSIFGACMFIACVSEWGRLNWKQKLFIVVCGGPAVWLLSPLFLLIVLWLAILSVLDDE